MLKSNAIKLFLMLHFYNPDRNGIIYDINPGELADMIGCNVRTIWNNLHVLQEYTYISYSKHSMGLLMLYSMIMRTTTFLPIREAVVFLLCPKN